MWQATENKMGANDGCATQPLKGAYVRVDGLEDRRGSKNVIYSLYGNVVATRNHDNVEEVLVTTQYLNMGLGWAKNFEWERWIPVTQCTVIDQPDGEMPFVRWPEGQDPFVARDEAEAMAAADEAMFEAEAELIAYLEAVAEADREAAEAEAEAAEAAWAAVEAEANRDRLAESVAEIGALKP